MSEKTNISIGIPFYNAESYLEDAICSVLAQTHTQWELILIDDGSTDGSLDIARRYAQKDSRIRLLSDGKNKKLPYRLNEIIRESRYDFIARMDADDLMSNDRLEKQLKILKNNNEIDFVTTGCLTIGRDNELTGIRILKNYQIDKEKIFEGLTNIIHASLLARKRWYLRNQYNETSLLAEDFELWLQAAKNNDLNYIVIEEPLYWYRVIENVTKAKVINGYNTQIRVIGKNYKGIISKSKKNKIVSKFVAKKLVVILLNMLGLMNLLLVRRYEDFDKTNLDFFEKNLKIINKYKD